MSVSDALKATVIPLVLLTEKSRDKDDETSSQTGGANGASYYIAMLIQIAIGVFAAYLSWQCNSMQNTFARVMYAIISYLFSGIYLIYYFVYRKLMGNKCM